MLTEPIQELLRKVEAAEKTAVFPPGEEVLEVNAIIGKATSFYEKVRYLIDYREEHTIRRSAIERILKRRIFIEQERHSGAILLQELTGGRYLERHIATEELAAELDAIVWKYLGLITITGVSGNISRQLLSFAATEIDERLSPREYALDGATVEAFFETMKGRVSVSGTPEETMHSQLYCAVWRSLLSADNERLSYALWLLYMPEWKTKEFNTAVVAERLVPTVRHIQNLVKEPVQWQIAPKIKNESIYFHIIRDIVERHSGDAEQILDNPYELEERTREFLAKKYEKENERIRSSGVRAVLYLLLTKMMVALAVEVPYELIVLNGIHYVPLGINILFHPLLLFMLTRGVGALDDSNTEAILAGVKRVLYEGKVRAVYIRNSYTRLSIAFAVIYFAILLFVFGALIGILQLLHFNPVSIALFLFFLALVSYFAFRIRHQARRWKVVENRGALFIIASVLAMPVVRVGRWLSRSFSSINIFVLIMDFIIETPFKRLLNFSNQFLVYLREKAEEMR